MLEIIYYVNPETGEIPVRKYIENIKKTSTQAKVKVNIFYVAEKNGLAGNFVTKNIRGYNFSEIRIKISKDLYRIIYCIWKSDYLVLLHIFSKKEGSATPQREFEIANENYQNFKNNQDLYF